MKSQNQVILSLGSNQGDRLMNLQNCIDTIHKQVGTVIKISNLYETSSWGFESEPFFNCALILHTYLSAHSVLEHVLAIEKQLGRIRIDKTSAYQARLIDIDVIAFNDEIIESDTLQVPHPLMQDRNFVLLPILDLNLNWIHPVFHKSINELIQTSSDKSSCIKIQKIESPLNLTIFDKALYLVIEGNIGAGKTTLANKIAQDFNVQNVLERFADNSFLPKFYEDQNRYAFPLEMSFLVDRYKQLQNDLSHSINSNRFVVADYHIFKSLIFAKITLNNEEFRLYESFFEILNKEMPKPNLLVYLHQNTDRLLQNIDIRGRDYEQNIPAEYLDNINNGYLNFIDSETSLNTLMIDMTNKDFVNNQEDYLFVLNEILKSI